MKCFICGKLSDLNNSSRNFNLQNKPHKIDILTSWKNECVSTICQVLFDNKSEYFVDYFQNANYCLHCEQIFRDLSFFWKQLQSFQNKIFQLSEQISDLLNSNYQKLKIKSESKVVQERVSSYFNPENSQHFSNYSFEEMVEIIHTSVSSSQQRRGKYSSGSSPEFISSNGNSEITSQSALASTLPVLCNVTIKTEDDSETNGNMQENDWSENPPEEDDLVESGESHSGHDEDSDWDMDDNESENSVSSNISVEQRRKSRKEHAAYSFRSTAAIKYTNESVKEKRIYCTGDNCQLYFSTELELHKHLNLIHKAEKPFKCKLCPNTYAVKSSLITHVKQAHEKTTFHHSCSFCRKSYERKEDLTVHYSNSHQEPNPFQCAFCTVLFHNREDLIQHTNEFHFKNQKDEGKLMNCCECQREFTNQRALRIHMANTHQQQQKEKIVYAFRCSFCGKQYVTEDEMTLHYSNSHQENPFQCAFCPELSTNRLELIKHTKELHSNLDKVPKYKCNICGNSYKTKSAWKYHYERNHVDEKNWSYKCVLCEKKFARERWLKAHMDIHSTEPKYKCEICGKLFKLSRQLTCHNKSYHRKGGYKCKVCGEILETERKLRTHRMSHDKKVKEKINANQKCKFCGKRYRNEEEINGHYSEAHLGPNPFTCAFCPEVYSNSFDLQNHMKSIHPDPSAKGERLKCDFCDRSFASKFSLKFHSRQHADPKLFKCDICAAVLAHPDIFRQHLERHAEDNQDVICETCGKSFKSTKRLKRHLRTHDESARNIKCKICDKAFLNRRSCKQHEVTHTDIKEFVCQICGKACNKKENLYSHMKIHTGETSTNRKRGTQN